MRDEVYQALVDMLQEAGDYYTKKLMEIAEMRIHEAMMYKDMKEQKKHIEKNFTYLEDALIILVNNVYYTDNKDMDKVKNFIEKDVTYGKYLKEEV